MSDREEGTYGRWHELCFACEEDMKEGVASRVVSCERGWVLVFSNETCGGAVCSDFTANPQSTLDILLMS